MRLGSLGELAGLFGKVAAGGWKIALAPCLDHIGREIEKEVKSEIGTYQSGIGPFPAWAPLSPVTLESKSKAGLGRGGPDTPLYATGDFEGDVSHKVDMTALSVAIGTNQKYIEYTELGTSNMPPRPVFGPSVLRTLPHLKPMIAGYAAAGITGFSVTGTYEGIH